MVSLGARIAYEHCNVRGVCHSGLLASLMDVHLPCSGMAALGMFGGGAATVSLSLAYLAPIGRNA